MQWILCIAALLLSLAAGYWVYRADLRRAVPYPLLTASLRTLLLLLTFLLLFAPALTVQKHETRKPVIVFLQDNSTSVADALKGDTAAYRRGVSDLQEKLKGQYRVVGWNFGGDVQTGGDPDFTQPATDISAALARVQEVFGQENLGAVILASDGRYNQGVNPQFQQLSLKSPVYTLVIGDSAQQKDLRIGRVYTNKTVPRNSRFEIRADIIAQMCSGAVGQIQLLKDGETLARTEISIPSDRYDRSVSFMTDAGKPGLHHYVLLLPAIEGEANTANNRKDIFVRVTDEEKRILIAAAAPHPDVNALREALRGQEDYRITVRSAGDLPADLSAYHAVILHNMPFRPAEVQALRKAGKPVWLICGPRSNPALINQLWEISNASVPASVVQDVQPAYNPSFSLFTVSKDIRAVADRMPPLAAPLALMKRAPGADPLFVARAGEDMPLWWMRQSDQPLAVLAGEGLWRWRLYEYKYFGTHAVVDECIRQTVQFLVADAREQPFRVTLAKYAWSDREAVYADASLLNANLEQVNTPEVTLSLKDSAGRSRDYSFERSGNAYRLNLGVLEGGYYSYTAGTGYNGKKFLETGNFVVETISPEQMQTGADYALLHAIARKYGGSTALYPGAAALSDSISSNKSITPEIHTVTLSLPLVDRKWYFLLLVLVAVAEWLLRKYWMAQ